MASTGLDFSKITPDNGAIRELSQLIMASVFAPDAVGGFINFIPNVYSGDKLGVVGEFGPLGVAYKGCGGDYDTNLIPANEKEWDIRRWQIKDKICFTDLESTLVKYMLKNGIDAPDLTGTEYMNDIIAPRLELAIRKLIWRLSFFGDKAAAASGSGGVIKNEGDVKYFNVTDGLWKRAFEAVAAGTMKRVSIDANTKTTKAAQQTAIKTAGAATDILDNIIAEASPVLRGMAEGTIYITVALKDAINADIKKTNKGSELQWNALFDGIQETTYDGVRVLAMPMWDEIIKGYEGTEEAWNKPYRAIYTVKDNMAVGSNSTTMLEQFDVWFDKKDDFNYIKAIDTLGTHFAQDDLAVVAY